MDEREYCETAPDKQTNARQREKDQPTLIEIEIHGLQGARVGGPTDALTFHTTIGAKPELILTENFLHVMAKPSKLSEC